MHICANHDVCVDSALEKANIICYDKGIRFTELRRKVLRMIVLSGGPTKAYDLLDRLNVEEAKAKPSTVYRTLDFLLENGLIHKLNSLNAYVSCSHPLKHNECYFLICSKCEQVTECCNNVLAQAITGTANENNFNPSHITLEIGGECKKCTRISKEG